MTHHGSGIEEQTYNAFRMYMFGDDLLDEYRDEIEDGPGDFIDWALKRTSVHEDYPDMSDDEIKATLLQVFYHEVEEWRQEQEECA